MDFAVESGGRHLSRCPGCGVRGWGVQGCRL